MGLLQLGETLSWEDSKKYLEYVKEHGIIQFLNCYSKYSDIQVQEFFLGR